MCTPTHRCNGDDFDLAEFPEHFRDLFRGPPGSAEPPEHRAARVAAARDVLAELLVEGEDDAVALEDAWYAVLIGGPTFLRGCRARAPRPHGRPTREAA
jgi:hypothetical protein